MFFARLTFSVFAAFAVADGYIVTHIAGHIAGHIGSLAYPNF